MSITRRIAGLPAEIALGATFLAGLGGMARAQQTPTPPVAQPSVAPITTQPRNPQTSLDDIWAYIDAVTGASKNVTTPTKRHTPLVVKYDTAAPAAGEPTAETKVDAKATPTSKRHTLAVTPGKKVVLTSFENNFDFSTAKTDDDFYQHIRSLMYQEPPPRKLKKAEKEAQKEEVTVFIPLRVAKHTKFLFGENGQTLTISYSPKGKDGVILEVKSPEVVGELKKEWAEERAPESKNKNRGLWDTNMELDMGTLNKDITLDDGTNKTFRSDSGSTNVTEYRISATQTKLRAADVTTKPPIAQFQSVAPPLQ